MTGGVLIIDDDLMNQKVMTALLTRSYGITDVYTAIDGKQGIEITLAKSPCLIFCDNYMPDYNGLAFLKFAQEAGIHTPIIMLTGASNLSVELLSNGATAVIIKPINRLELATLLDKYLI